ncbi:DUF732 domain-containing protein [Mycobacterium hodleri]|uniref:hypothetical protein n=1 Tax=Mycolicibacterium hodleri TaxID=49897 RepID=UPI0021F34414|nr:hypothetical protein [Mycolicibacterium hodleri]MCV7133923.1 DUF732 domain-containing protein [Mycolicibacterium hodleri]
MTTETLTLALPIGVATPRNRRRWSAIAVRLVVSATATIGVAVAIPAPASADAGDASLLGDFGIGNNGAISQLIAQFATSLCPMLVQPGSQVVSTATTASGHGGLGSQLAGGVAGLAIQTQCPNFMTSLANGDFTVLSNAASMLGMATPGANSLSSVTGALPGALATPGT